MRPLALFVGPSILTALALGTIRCGDAGASPGQPVPFPHAPHRENQIDCAFCHEFSDRQASAGMPRTELCGGCHLAMSQEAPAIQKLLEYVDAEEQIPWVRLYQLPQFAYFTHEWHVLSGIACEECHGNIGESIVALRHLELDMDWCLDCHEERGAPVDCVVCHK